MWKALVAWIYLALAFWRHVLLLRPWRRPRYGLDRFRANYAPDGLRPLTPQERERQPLHARCISCGLCVAAFVEAETRDADREPGTPPPPAAPLPALPVRYARAGHDAWAVDVELQPLLATRALAVAESVCPTQVPLADVARFILRAKHLA
ncbi:MAG TPA: hypothetical protein VG389_08895 [Myxococcota bacterium]|jgi:hypothetical protein|nr:hypothetical protein [Myxococcota bacterium]